MPSRKKAKGRARKARANASNLILHNDSVCRHGCGPISKEDICYQFVKQFEVELNAAFDLYYDTHHQLADLYNETFDRLQANNQFNMIWDDKLMQKRVLPLFVSLGTNLILSTKTRCASHMASVVAMVIATSSHNFDRSEAIRKTERTRCLLRDLEDGLEYDSAKLLFKSSPCQCLKKIYYRLKPLPRVLFAILVLPRRIVSSPCICAQVASSSPIARLSVRQFTGQTINHGAKGSKVKLAVLIQMIDNDNSNVLAVCHPLYP